MPITSWSEKKALIKTNIEIEPSTINGLAKKSIADCLQTRPIDYKYRLVKIIGKLTSKQIEEIDEALAIVFDIHFR